MKIYIVRHGETNWNLEKRLQGREDIPLNDTGIMQAHMTGQALKGRNIKLVVSSPLSRAMDTALIIALHIGTGEPLREEALIERDYGSLSGMRVADTYGITARDGEKPELVLERFARALDRYVKIPGGDMLIVSHGGAIREFLRNIPDSGLDRSELRLKNACISILDYTDGRYSVDCYDLTAQEFSERKRSAQGLNQESFPPATLFR